MRRFNYKAIKRSWSDILISRLEQWQSSFVSAADLTSQKTSVYSVTAFVITFIESVAVYFYFCFAQFKP